MNVRTGGFILAADGLHGRANSAPTITAIAPAAWLVPQDTLHSIAGQTVTLLGGHVPQAGQVLRVRAATRRLAVGRDCNPFTSTFRTGDQHGQIRDRKSVGSGKSVSVRVDLGGRRYSKKKQQNNNDEIHYEKNI